MRFEPCYSAISGYYRKLHPSIVALSSVIQGKSAFERGPYTEQQEPKFCMSN